MKLPWKVEYCTCDSWHAKASPIIMDADDQFVAEVPQFVDHPGDYDERADKLAHMIVNAVNEVYSQRPAP